MRDARIWVGVAFGLLVALALRASTRDPGPPPAHGALLADTEGALEEIVIQYVRAAAPAVASTYRAFLARLPAGVRVLVLCPAGEDFADLRARVGPVACRLEPVAAGHAMTAWSRDRWLAFGPGAATGKAWLLAPRDEGGADLWPQRAGDRRVAFDLEAAEPGRVQAYRGQLLFDGGDFVADAETAFVTPRVLRRNLGQTVESAAHLRAHLERLTGRHVVLLERAPDHHAGMFMMVAGSRTVLVGDPSLAASEESAALGLAVDRGAATQADFDGVAARCLAEGYRVVRMPVVPGKDGRTWWTWLNVVLDREAGRGVVYMPVFDGAAGLNDRAQAIWEGLGFTVRRVDCTATYPHFGSLRCLVNVLRRRAP